MESSNLPPELELLLTIRFSASIPDMPLEIPDPTTTTAAGLKQIIRKSLPEALAKHRLRLIYAGKALQDTEPLSTALNIKPANRHSSAPSLDPSGKGKAAIRDPPRVNKPRIYIHCSIGDIVLSTQDLAAEAASARKCDTDQEADASLRKAHGSSRDGEASLAPGLQGLSGGGEAPSTTPAPQGFDRLLATGFTVGEVSALRSQFLALQSLTYTPDTMPSGSELRRLEDRWLDEDSTGGNAGAGSAAPGAGAGSTDDGVSAGLDDMLWGSVMGFFWPLGCAMWLLKEEGVWSWRKGLAVFVGLAVNFGFGIINLLG